MNLNELISAGMKPADALKFRAGLYSKVEIISNAIGGLKKEGQASLGGGKGYKFITHEQVTEAVRPLFKKHNLSVVFEVVEYHETPWEVVKNYNGQETKQQWVRTTITIAARITDTESGYQETLSFTGAEQDNGGKSMQQAISQAVKYCQFKLFKITENDTDGDKELKTIESQRTAPTAKPQTTAASTPSAIKAAAEKCKNTADLGSLWKGLTANERADNDNITLFQKLGAQLRQK